MHLEDIKHLILYLSQAIFFLSLLQLGPPQCYLSHNIIMREIMLHKVQMDMILERLNMTQKNQ